MEEDHNAPELGTRAEREGLHGTYVIYVFIALFSFAFGI